MGVYKHHFELFLKGVAIYVALIGGSVAYGFHRDATPEIRSILMTFLAAVSVLAIYGCWTSFSWVSEIEVVIKRVSASISSEPIPLWGAKRIVSAVLAGAVLVLALSAYTVVAGLR